MSARRSIHEVVEPKSHGRLPEAARTWPGASHSPHPVDAFAAIGADAGWVVSGQSLDEGYGTASPLARLVERDGAVLLLGAPLESVTLLHYAEYLAAVEPKRWVEYEMPVRVEGNRVWRKIRELDCSLGAFAYDDLHLDDDAFAAITRSALSAGIGRSGTAAQPTPTYSPRPNSSTMPWRGSNATSRPEHAADRRSRAVRAARSPWPRTADAALPCRRLG